MLFQRLRQPRLQPRRHMPIVPEAQVFADRSGLSRLHAVLALEHDVARRRLARNEFDDLHLEAKDPENHRPERIRQDVAKPLPQN